MSRSKLHETLEPITLFRNANVNSSDVAGATIVEPWKKGRQLMICITAGTLASNDVITFRVQMRRKGTSTWDNLIVPGTASTAVAFSGQVGTGGTSITGRLAAGNPVFGVLDLTRLPTSIDGPPGIAGAASTPAAGNAGTYEYDALRITGINAVAQNVACSAVGIIGDQIASPVATVALEDLFNKQRYKNGNPNDFSTT